MKRVPLCLLVASFSIGSAVAADWEGMRRDPRLKIDEPEFVLYSVGARKTGSFSALDLCRSGGSVRTTHPIQVCLKEETDYSSNAPYFPKRCVRSAAFYFERSIETFDPACARWAYLPNSSGYAVRTCVKTEVRPATFPLHHEIRVEEFYPTATYYAKSKSREWREPFDIPSCE